MSYIKQLIIILVFSFGFSSCEEVVDLDLPNGGERLIVDASINWEKGTMGNEQSIFLYLSTSYYSKNIKVTANNALVKVINLNDNTEVEFKESEPGKYTTDKFQPVLNTSYKLQIEFNSEIYEGIETLYSVSKINSIDQSEEEFFGEKVILVTAQVTDEKNVDNYYYSQFRSYPEDSLLSRSVFSDELSDGNDLNIEYGADDIESGDKLEVIVFGVSNSFNNYMSLLLDQTGGGGGPFSTIPAKLVGNCVNISNPQSEVLGYFRLSETEKKFFTVQ